jgi:adenylate cyclase class IV
VLESFEKIDKRARKSFLHIYQEDLYYSKVIGNFYQNSELLGGQDE